MTSYIQNLITSIKGELIKKKKSGIYLLGMIMGAIPPVFLFFWALFNEEDKKAGLPYNLYIEEIDLLAIPYTGFFFVIAIIYNASKITQIDHKNGGWQLMELLPLHRFSMYTGKYLILLSANALSILSFLLLSVLSVFALSHIQTPPDHALTAVPWGFLSLGFVKIFFASLFLTTLIYFVSVLIKNHIWTVVIGFSLFIVNVLLSDFNHSYFWSPFEILRKTAYNLEGGQLSNVFIFSEKLSLVLTGITLLIGYYWFHCKTFKRAFLQTKSKIALSLTVLVAASCFLWWYTKPKLFQERSKTVMAGAIKSDHQIGNVYVIHPTLTDTIATIPVENDQFHHVFNTSLRLVNYMVLFDDLVQERCYFSDNDSIYMELEFANKTPNVEIKGTRLAENSYSRGNQSWNNVKYQIDQNKNLENFDKLQEQLYSEYESAIEDLEGFRTVDNYTTKEDFNTLLVKEQKVHHLNYFEKLKSNTESLYPDKKLEIPDYWTELKSGIMDGNMELIDNEEFIDYYTRRLKERDTTDNSEQQKILNQLALLKPSRFRDALLFITLKDYYRDSRNNREREELKPYIAEIGKEKYVRQLNTKHNNLMKTGRGNPVQDFKALNIEGETVRLSDLSGKFVMLDFWATWCGPCSYQSPYFEKTAAEYKNENVVFVAVSLDKDQTKWFVEAKKKSKNVLQWWAGDAQTLKKTFQISGIPRFVLIDDEGNFYQSKVGMPSDAGFEMILRKALGLPDLE